MKTKQNLRAAILTRVSTREQAESGTSLQTQEQHAREYIEGCGYTLVENYVIGEDHTGTDLERPGIKRLLHGASIGMFDVVVCLTQDRVYRPAEAGDEWRLLELLDRFKKMGVSFEFSTGSVPSDGPFAGMFSILDSWRAGEERRKIVERTQLGRRARLAEGKYLHVPPFGYETDEDGRLQVNTEQAEIVRRIFDLYLTERLGVRKIQSLLTGTVPSPNGRHVWSQNTILRILKSECYWSGRHSSGVPCPPIIEEQQAVQAHKRLESNRWFKPAKGKPWALQGRIRCACAGTWRTEKAGPGKGQDTYYCRNRLSASYYAMSKVHDPPYQERGTRLLSSRGHLQCHSISRGSCKVDRGIHRPSEGID